MARAADPKVDHCLAMRPEDPTESEHQNLAARRYAVPLLLMLAIAVRFIGLHEQSLTVDECLERQTAESSVGEIYSAPNSFPPLYHLAAKVWLAFDSHELSLRHFSLLLGLISVLAVKQLVTEGMNAKTGWVAGFLAAVSPFHVYYSQQGRCYMLFILLGTWAMLYGLRILRGGSGSDRVKFILAGAAGGYTHYYMAPVLVGIGVGVLLTAGWQFVARRLLPSAIAIGVLCIPLFLLVSGDLEYQVGIRAPRAASVGAVGYTFFSFESGYTLGPSRSRLHYDEAKQEAVSRLSPWVVVALPVVIVLLLRSLPVVWAAGEFWYWASLIAIPLLVVVAVCWLSGVTYNTRFMVCCWMPYLLFISNGFVALSPRFRLAVLVVLAAMYMTAIYNRNFVDSYRNEDMRAAAEFIETQGARPTYVCSGYMHLPLRHYSGNGADIHAMRDLGYPDGSIEEAMRFVATETGDFWLVYSRPFHGDPKGEILRALQESRDLKPAFKSAGVEIFDGAAVP